MIQSGSRKCLMDGYVGVKFQAQRISATVSPDVMALFDTFAAVCKRLRYYQMTPANGGNLSVRHGDGMVISASGANLGCLERTELIHVTSCQVTTWCEAEAQVCYQGTVPPSSEAIMHWRIYVERPDAGAIIHAHDELATRSELLQGQVTESEQEEPYGSLALAQRALDAFQQSERIIVLKNHGYVAIGSDLAAACDLVVATHLHLVGGNVGLTDGNG